MTKILKPSTSFLDFPDNKSMSVSLFMLGCGHHCPGCQSPKLKEKNNFLDEEIWINTEKNSINNITNQIRELLKKHRTNKLVLTGGDPLHYSNIEFTKEICKELIKECEICIYTGYQIKYIKDLGIRDFTYIKCGMFNHKLYQKSNKNDDRMVLASSNQNFYNNKYEQLSNKGILNFKRS